MCQWKVSSFGTMHPVTTAVVPGVPPLSQADAKVVVRGALEAILFLRGQSPAPSLCASQPNQPARLSRLATAVDSLASAAGGCAGRSSPAVVLTLGWSSARPVEAYELVFSATGTAGSMGEEVASAAAGALERRSRPPALTQAPQARSRARWSAFSPPRRRRRAATRPCAPSYGARRSGRAWAWLQCPRASRPTGACAQPSPRRASSSACALMAPPAAARRHCCWAPRRWLKAFGARRPRWRGAWGGRAGATTETAASERPATRRRHTSSGAAGRTDTRSLIQSLPLSLRALSHTRAPHCALHSSADVRLCQSTARPLQSQPSRRPRPPQPAAPCPAARAA